MKKEKATKISVDQPQGLLDRVLLLRVRIALHHLRLCLVRRSADPTLFFGEG